MGFNGPQSPLLIGSLTASNSATISFTNISPGYSSYFLLVSNVVPITAGDNLQMLVNTGSGYIVTNYLSGVNRIAYNATSITNTHSTTAFLLSGPISTSVNYYAKFRMYNASNGQPVSIVGLCSYQDNASGVMVGGMIAGTNTATNITAIQFACSTGNISSGVFSLYATYS